MPWGPSKSVPEDIQRVIDRLTVQQAITDVLIMSQATESHLFSQVRVCVCVCVGVGVDVGVCV